MKTHIEIANRVAGLLNSGTERLALLQRVCVQLRDDLKAEVTSIFARQPEGCKLIVNVGLNQSFVGSLFLDNGVGLVNHVVQTARALCLHNATTHNAFHYVKGLGEEDLLGYIGVPIFRRGAVIGVLVVQYREEHDPQLEEIALLETISQQISDLVLGKRRGKPEQPRVKTRLDGRGMAPGIFHGKVSRRLFMEDSLLATGDGAGLGYEVEKKRLDEARTRSLRFLAELKSRSEQREVQEILSSHLTMLNDPLLMGKMDEHLRQNVPAEKAVSLAVREIARAFENISDPYIRQRSLDVLDIGRRLYHSLSQPEDSLWSGVETCVHIVNHLPAPTLIEGGTRQFGALIMVDESIYSHAIILAKSMSIPTVIIASDQVPAIQDAERLLVDGEMGTILINPSDLLVENYIKSHAQAADLERTTQGPCRTADGEDVLLAINISFPRDVENLPAWVPEVGLYRTEFEYFVSPRMPDETEQTATYARILSAMGQRPVNMRILDVGGDKSPPSMHFMHEDNPIMGHRSIRYLFRHSEIFFSQLRAMLKAQHQTGGHLRIIIPMVTVYEEVSRVRDHLAKALRDLKMEGIEVEAPPLGAMIEVPSCVNLIPRLAKIVEFFSIGTNDLLQYYMASDRTNPRVSHLCRWHHPTFLATLSGIFRQCRSVDRKVSVCGEMAGELWGSLVLAGLGCRILSMDKKALIRHHGILAAARIGDLERLSQVLIDCDTSIEVMEKLQLFLDAWEDLPDQHRELLQTELASLLGSHSKR